MRKLITLILSLAFLLFSCDTGDMENTERFSLIGTWETSGEIVVNGDQRSYKCTLTFNENDYIEVCETKSKQGAFHLTDTYSGEYTRDEEKITGTYSYSGDYHNGNLPSTGGPYDWNNTYKFINKYTLDFKGPGAKSINNYINGNLIYERKY